MRPSFVRGGTATVASLGTEMPVLIVAHRSGPGAVKVANGSGGGAAPLETTPFWTVAVVVVTRSSFLTAARSDLEFDGTLSATMISRSASRVPLASLTAASVVL